MGRLGAVSGLFVKGWVGVVILLPVLHVGEVNRGCGIALYTVLPRWYSLASFSKSKLSLSAGNDTFKHKLLQHALFSLSLSLSLS